MTLDLLPVVTAVKDQLDANLSVTVEAGERTVDPPVVVVHAIPGGSWLRTLDNQWDDAETPVQLTCVGRGWEQAVWLADQSRAVLLAEPFPDGVKHVRPDDITPGATPDWDTEPPVWISTPVYYLTV